jgi:hypothetical protein
VSTFEGISAATSSGSGLSTWREVGVRVLQERVQRKADVAIVAARRPPDREEHVLGLADQPVRPPPGDFLIVEPFTQEAYDVLITVIRLD